MADYELNGIRITVPDVLIKARVGKKLADGGYEAAEARAAARLIGAGDRVLELGGGLGYITAVCARLTAPENVVSVEANPRLLPILRQNLETNGLAAVRIIHGAVAEPENPKETVEFQIPKSFVAGRLAAPEGGAKNTIDVPLLRIADLLAEHQPSVVLMDIEGAEAQLFAHPWPDCVRNVVLELHPNHYRNAGVAIKRIVDCMSDTGLTYDPVVSRGRILAFRRVQEA